MHVETDRDENKWLHFGFEITTTPGDIIIDNAAERIQEGLLSARHMTKNMGDFKPDVAIRIGEDLATLEKRCAVELQKATGIIFRPEGHFSNDDLGGSCWVNVTEHPEAVQFIFENANDINQEPGTDPWDVPNLNWNRLVKGLHVVIKKAVDITFGFIDIDKEDMDVLDDNRRGSVIDVEAVINGLKQEG
jgi:hypothetical protein